MLSPDLVAFFHSGCALIAAVVADDGRPVAVRGWGIEIVDAEAGRCRLLVGAEVVASRGVPVAGGTVAVTGADVLSLRSAQLKGTIEAVTAPTDADLALHARYCDRFLGAILAVDDQPRSVTERFVPDHLLVCHVVGHELYDQTPGPGAGERLGTGAR